MGRFLFDSNRFTNRVLSIKGMLSEEVMRSNMSKLPSFRHGHNDTDSCNTKTHKHLCIKLYPKYHVPTNMNDNYLSNSILFAAISVFRRIGTVRFMTALNLLLGHNYIKYHHQVFGHILPPSSSIVTIEWVDGHVRTIVVNQLFRYGFDAHAI